MKLPSRHDLRQHVTFAKGVLAFAVLCGVVLFTFRDSGRHPHGKRRLFTAAASLAPVPSSDFKAAIAAPAPLFSVVPMPNQSGAKAVPQLAIPAPAPKTASAVPAPIRHRHHRRLAHYSKRSRAIVTKTVPAPPPVVTELDKEEPGWLDKSLAAEEQASAVDSDQGEDLFDVTDEALQIALSDPDGTEEAPGPEAVSWQLDQAFLADREILPVFPILEVAGLFKRNEFGEIRERLESLAKEADGLSPVAAPVSAVMSEAGDKPAPQIVKPPVEATTATAVVAAAANTPAAIPSSLDSAAPAAPAARLTEVRARTIDAAEERAEEPRSASGPAVALGGALASAAATAAETAVDTGPVLVEPAAAALTTQATAVTRALEPTLVVPTHATAPVAQAVASQPAATQGPTLVRSPVSDLPQRRPIPSTAVAASDVQTTAATVPGIGAKHERDTAPAADESQDIDDFLYGKLLVENPLTAWLAANKAHIELNLHPINSRDPQDTVFIEYQYPAAEFQMDARELKGEYRLLADIYRAQDKAPYAQLIYPTPISAATAKQRVLFRLNLSDVEQSKLSSPVRHRNLALSGSLFEGAVGDYRNPPAVGQGQVQVIGFPEWGAFPVGTDGTFKIPSVPGSSELMLEVFAKGYYPTFHTVPTFSSDLYSPVYLISQDKVDVVTKYFTHHPQKDADGLLIGRVFDPITRAPQKEERLSLSFRRSGPVYFGALGALPIVPGASGTTADSLETTENGMFAFFNLAPSVRAVSRDSGKPSLLLNVHPHAAEYIELGRGGKRNLRGQVLDRKSPVAARVRLVGDRHLEVETDEEGTFILPDIDLPPGVVTLEVEADGYPRSWFSVAWNPREPETSHLLYVVDKELIYGRAATAAQVKVDSNRGVLVAQSALFPKKSACVRAALYDAEGRPVSTEMGPFPMFDGRDSGTPVCLTREKPWFTFFNLPAGEYVLKLAADDGRPIRSHVVRVGVDRVSFAVN